MQGIYKAYQHISRQNCKFGNSARERFSWQRCNCRVGLERKKATAGRTRALKNAKLLCFIIVSYKYCMSCMDNRQGEIEKSEDDLTFFSLVFSTSAVQLFF